MDEETYSGCRDVLYQVSGRSSGEEAGGDFVCLDYLCFPSFAMGREAPCFPTSQYTVSGYRSYTDLMRLF